MNDIASAVYTWNDKIYVARIATMPRLTFPITRIRAQFALTYTHLNPPSAFIFGKTLKKALI